MVAGLRNQKVLCSNKFRVCRNHPTLRLLCPLTKSANPVELLFHFWRMGTALVDVNPPKRDGGNKKYAVGLIPRPSQLPLRPSEKLDSKALNMVTTWMDTKSDADKRLYNHYRKTSAVNLEVLSYEKVGNALQNCSTRSTVSFSGTHFLRVIAVLFSSKRNQILDGGS